LDWGLVLVGNFDLERGLLARLRDLERRTHEEIGKRKEGGAGEPGEVEEGVTRTKRRRRRRAS